MKTIILSLSQNFQENNQANSVSHVAYMKRLCNVGLLHAKLWCDWTLGKVSFKQGYGGNNFNPDGNQRRFFSGAQRQALRCCQVGLQCYLHRNWMACRFYAELAKAALGPGLTDFTVCSFWLYFYEYSERTNVRKHFQLNEVYYHYGFCHCYMPYKMLFSKCYRSQSMNIVILDWIRTMTKGIQHL